MIIPIDIINNILVYVTELNIDLVYIHYDSKNREIYKINNYCDKIWNIQAINKMKIYYPLTIIQYINKHYDLYKYGKKHYTNLLKSQYPTHFPITNKL